MITKYLLVVLAAVSVASASAQPTPEPAWRDKVRSYAESSFRHPAWGYGHSLRNYQVAKQLAAEDRVEVDDDVLFAAAMLHDLAAFPAHAQKDVDHADRAVELVGNILRDTGFPMEKLPAVQSAIRTHMFFRDPVGPEATYLHDADALDWLGAVGIARLTATVDLTGTVIGGTPDGATVVKGLQANLEMVPPRVLSKAGKALVPARVASLKRYLDELAEQTDAYKNL